MTRKEKKRQARLAYESHKMDQRWRDAHDRSYPCSRRKRWRFVPQRPFEYELAGYGQIVSVEPALSVVVTL